MIIAWCRWSVKLRVETDFPIFKGGYFLDNSHKLFSSENINSRVLKNFQFRVLYVYSSESRIQHSTIGDEFPVATARVWNSHLPALKLVFQTKIEN